MQRRDDQTSRDRARARAGALLVVCLLLAGAAWWARACREPGTPSGSACRLAWDARHDQMLCARLDVESALRASQPLRLPVAQAQALGLPFDINAASADNLRRVSGIGVRRAARIVELRDVRGGFCTLDELADVHGIGPSTVERLRTRLYVTPAARCGDATAP